MTLPKIFLRNSPCEISLTPVLCDPRLGIRDAILVIPGGGYGCVCDDREGSPIAMAFAARGMNAFILKYSVGKEAADFQPLVDASLAMAHIKAHAEEYNIDPKRIATVGFSAGGHLSGALGCLWKLPEIEQRTGIDHGDNRPLATVMGYPVVSAVNYPHLGSFYNILGKKSPTEEELRKYSLELCVDKDTSPAFLFHTAEDRVVPVQNSLAYSYALAQNDIRFELHIYPYGPHGLALASPLTECNNPDYVHPEAERWVDDAVRFLRSLPSRD